MGGWRPPPLPYPPPPPAIPAIPPPIPNLSVPPPGLQPAMAMATTDSRALEPEWDKSYEGFKPLIMELTNYRWAKGGADWVLNWNDVNQAAACQCAGKSADTKPEKAPNDNVDCEKAKHCVTDVDTSTPEFCTDVWKEIYQCYFPTHGNASSQLTTDLRAT
eukprot:1059150-Rhodomonas_salina.1